MLRFALRRLVGLVIAAIAASLVVFIVLEVLPGDPAQVMLGINATEDTLAALRAELGLDQPPVARYFDWVGGMLTGDFGRSYTYAVPVAELITDRIAVSVPLALMAIVLSTAIAIPLGVYAASRHGRLGDTAVMTVSQLGVAMPNFWLGLLFILLLAVEFKLLPAGGFPGWEAGIWAGVAALILPATALALPQAAILARVARSAVLETMGADYIRTARAKGLSRAQALWRHALRNAMIPVVTIMGLQFSFLIAGAIIIESVFTLPGLGRLIFQAIAQRDLIVVESVVTLLAVFVITVNFAVDLLYALIDPRLRDGHAR